jgi:hypothetical protein
MASYSGGSSGDESWEDVFQAQVSRRTTNESNLAGHYEYNPERWRIYKTNNDESNRLYPEYNTVSEYNHTGDYHELKPAGGETIIFESAERFRYTVQYELEFTWAWAINQSLSGDDYVRIGYYDGDDGWFMEHNATHSSNEADFVLLREGSEQYRNTGTVGKGGFQTNTRFGLETAWYDVTRQRWTQSYSENGEQRNPVIAKESNDDSRGPATGNQHLRYEVKADANTSGLILEAGSCAVVSKGSGKENLRVKSAYFKDSVGSTSTYEPIRAFRGNSTNEVVNNQIVGIDALSYSSDTDTEVIMTAFSSENVTFGGGDSWSTPNAWGSLNSSVETRTDVSNIVDSGGSSTTTATDPGGFQIGFTTLIPTSGNQFQKGVSRSGQGAKRNLPEGDIGVVLVNVGQTGDLGYGVTWEQDW